MAINVKAISLKHPQRRTLYYSDGKRLDANPFPVRDLRNLDVDLQAANRLPWMVLGDDFFRLIHPNNFASIKDPKNKKSREPTDDELRLIEFIGYVGAATLPLLRNVFGPFAEPWVQQLKAQKFIKEYLEVVPPEISLTPKAKRHFPALSSHQLFKRKDAKVIIKELKARRKNHSRTQDNHDFGAAALARHFIRFKRISKCALLIDRVLNQNETCINELLLKRNQYSATIGTFNPDTEIVPDATILFKDEKLNRLNLHLIEFEKSTKNKDRLDLIVLNYVKLLINRPSVTLEIYCAEIKSFDNYKAIRNRFWDYYELNIRPTLVDKPPQLNERAVHEAVKRLKIKMLPEKVRNDILIDFKSVTYEIKK